MNGSSSTTSRLSPPCSGPCSPRSPDSLTMTWSTRASPRIDPGPRPRPAEASALYPRQLSPPRSRRRRVGPVTIAGGPCATMGPHAHEREADRMQVLDTFLDAMGNTPLVRLHAVTPGVRPTVLAKLEMLNPGGSVKDRIGHPDDRGRRARRPARPGRDHRRADLAATPATGSRSRPRSAATAASS